jgi:uncharacterized protein (TIGR02246 family)
MLGLALGIIVPASGQQASTQSDQQAQRKEIEEISTKLADGLMKHDAAALAALFAADGILVSPFGVQNGRQAIEQSYEQLFQRFGVKTYAHIVDQVHEAGTTRAYGVGHWDDMAVPTGKTEAIHLSGYWATFYEKQSDGWKIAVNSWSLAPPPPPAK